ncbi:MAG: PAS domain S-box protein [Gammaproteobacteria bacterium]|nr:PAS domain S-box protein [Gammaproteobacteria bacterium]
MQTPATPDNENERLLALRNLSLLDTPPEPRFDRITRITKALFAVPITLVSLVDSERQWFKSRQGLDACETGRDISFCGHAILKDDLFIINDALNDARFADNPLVSGEPHIRFYAGAPLHAPGGERIGTLCLIDREPRELTAAQQTMLRDLGDSIEELLQHCELLAQQEILSNMALVAEHTSNSAIIADPKGEILWVNRGFERTTGYTLEEVIGKKPGSLLQGPETDPKTVAIMGKALANGEGFAVEAVNYKKDGTPYWCDIRTQPITDAEGTIRKYIAIETDITEKKNRSLEQTRQMDALHGTLLFAEFNPDGTFITANEHLCQTTGYRLDELTKMHHHHLLSKMQQQSPEYIDFWQRLNQGETLSGEFPRLTKNGDEIWLQAYYTPVLGIQGKVSRIIKIATDITEMVNFRNQLKSNESRIRAILETVIDGIITIDERGIIESFNPASERLFAYQANEVIGKNIKMLMPEPYSSQHDGYLHNYITTNKAKIIGIGREVVGRRKDGSNFAMELAVGEMELQGRRLFTGIVRDISEQKRNAVKLDMLNRDLSLKLNQLAELNQINSLLNEMGTFFQLAQSLDELYKIMRKYGQQLFARESGAFYGIVTRTFLEEIFSWNSPKGKPDFQSSACWSLRRGEAYEVEDVNEHLLCSHLEPAHQEDKLSYSLCIPVLSQEGAVGMISIYGHHHDAASDRDERQGRMQRNRQILTDIADRFGTAMSNIKLREKLRTDSTMDPLTGLFNRRFFEEASELELRRSKRNNKPLSLIMVDADHFKSFNDEYGHDTGDYVLKTIARVLRESCRDNDIPTRLGGEEFAILLSASDSHSAVKKAEEIRLAIAAIKLLFNDKPLRSITLSLGVATIPDDANEIAFALTLADKALYHAKSSGRNRVVAVHQLP